MTIREIYNELKRLQEEEKRGVLYCEIAYYLVKNYHFSKSINAIEPSDLMILVDNLYINNEILDSDNLSDYDDEALESLNITKRDVNRLKRDTNAFILLNYYNINGDLKRAKMFMSYLYRALD